MEIVKVTARHFPKENQIKVYRRNEKRLQIFIHSYIHVDILNSLNCFNDDVKQLNDQDIPSAVLWFSQGPHVCIYLTKYFRYFYTKVLFITFPCFMCDIRYSLLEKTEHANYLG